MADPLNVGVFPLTPNRWPDLESVFRAKGCSAPRGCWFMFYRESGKVPVPAGMRLSDVRRFARRRPERPVMRVDLRAR